ncbi:hypothetical protein AOQ84DRAFT_439464 [Glonium stellatum]|uniref:Zn(2)-C6 fungal-type domain-containing protein n=1 Tax=Glonium stellatum TaxID=574774 RepID=A0A8E2JTD2_9PEZI|nr:hypothetical protein AOQ84DRAFT_439464 [Glonium stellatum]
MSITMTNALQSPFYSPSQQVFSSFSQENLSEFHHSHDDYNDTYQQNYQQDYQGEDQFYSDEAPRIQDQPLLGGVPDSQPNHHFDLTMDEYNHNFIPSLDYHEPEPFPVQTQYEPSPTSTNPASHPSPASDANPPAAERKYELRAAARNVMNIPQTWYDQDESGTYDPAAERRRPAAARKRKLSALNGKAEPINSSSEDCQKEPSLIVTFRFASSSAYDVLRQCPDNEPVQYLDGRDPSNPNGFLDSDEDDGGAASPSRPLSSRRHARSRQNLNNSPPLPAIPDPLGLVDDLRHHPAARGCKICRKANTVCPLQTFGGSYPCTYCVTEDVHCELITPPTIKDACLRCQRFRRRCSYLHDGTAEGPCDECVQEWKKARDSGDEENEQEPCLAGPAPGSGPRAWIELMPVTERKFKACTACRQVKKRCSLKSKTAKPPCRSCKDAGIECTFEEICRMNKGSVLFSRTSGISNEFSPGAAFALYIRYLGAFMSW